jgi:hypothetical protein
MLIETMQSQGVDSFAALAAATIQGSTETTFYVLAVYFGAVGIQRARHAVPCALVAELAGVVAAIVVCYQFLDKSQNWRALQAVLHQIIQRAKPWTLQLPCSKPPGSAHGRPWA